MADRVGELTATIATETAKVNAYLHARHMPNLSFDADVPYDAQQDREFTDPRNAAVEAAEELLALLGGSTRSVFTQKITDLVNLHAVCRFDIATKFPQDQETASYEELGKVAGLSESDVRRVVRGAITNHVFKEQQPGRVAHTAASRFLAQNRLARQWIEMASIETMPASMFMVPAMTKWPGSGEPNEAGYNVVYQTNDVCWDHMPKFPGRAEVFADAMSVFTSGSGYGPEALVDYFEKKLLTTGTIVDVGGSHGSVSIPIARAHPEMRVIVQDLPAVVKVGETNVPDDVKDRVQFMAHDFFTEQPIKGADVYLMRWILHDWSDEYASKIVKALVPALKKGARLLVHEYVVPEPGKGSAASQLSFRWMDVMIRGLCNGKERDEQDWEALFARVDARFQIRNFYQSHLSKLGIVDVEWCPE
ncbi:S-adenosyl-L-methionine-dependent methyltransferase [Polyplosphaeria fusca]|uniref:S-adenosyl-L-methionine-dependent methyltransferase n=1 Tax=Polyplosphaeria fusca TaxID=682080 RepID=A0A9P4R8Y9_9PLEO|nr:S-adenosyl-L-methionine-dependent methyltransferase [Polyplosphaeria fusca]